MKPSIWILLGISACTGIITSTKPAPKPLECVQPAVAVIVDDVLGELLMCQKGDNALCCAYGFLPTHQDICYHVLCQPLDCYQEWEYIKTVCPPAPTEEENVSCPAKSNEYKLNQRLLNG